MICLSIRMRMKTTKHETSLSYTIKVPIRNNRGIRILDQKSRSCSTVRKRFFNLMCFALNFLPLEFDSAPPCMKFGTISQQFRVAAFEERRSLSRNFRRDVSVIKFVVHWVVDCPLKLIIITDEIFVSGPLGL
jgi:hypothetical protein